MTLPVLVLLRSEGAGADRYWSALIALTSPLAAYLSLSLLPLWSFGVLAGTVAISLALQSGSSDRSRLAVFSVGLVCGYACGVYPSFSILALALFLLILSAKARRGTLIAFVLGGLVGAAPFAIETVAHRDSISPKVVVSSGPVHWLELFSGCWRYIGAPPGPLLNTSKAIGNVEYWLRCVSPYVGLFVLVLSIGAVVLARKRDQKFPPFVRLMFFVYPAYLAFTLITHSESWQHQAGNLWWVGALAVPWASRIVLGRGSYIINALIVTWNVVCIAIVLGPRLWLGTVADDMRGQHSHGPAWWMQDRVLSDIADEAKRRAKLGCDSQLVMGVQPVFQYYPQRLFNIRYPELTGMVVWTPDLLTASDGVIITDRIKPNRLVTRFGPRDWAVRDQPFRAAVRIESECEFAGPCQVCILAERGHVAVEFVNNHQEVLPYCVEEQDGSSNLWLRLDGLQKGITRVCAYYGNKRALLRGLSSPSKVFSFYSDHVGFDNPQSGANATPGSGEPKGLSFLPGGVAPFVLDVGTPGNPESGIVEAKFRFHTLPTQSNAGIVLISSADESKRYWLLTGDGATSLVEYSRLRGLLTLDFSQWFWHGKPMAYYKVGVGWKSGLYTFWAQGWSGYSPIFTFYDADWQKLSRVGFAAVRYQPTKTDVPDIDVAWVRERANYGDKAPRVRWENEEHQ